MASVFALILNMDITASLIICVVLLARLCMHRLPKIYSYVLWSVVLFRLLCPVSISLPVSVLSPWSGASSQSSAATSMMEYIPVQPARPALVSAADAEGNITSSASVSDTNGLVTSSSAVIAPDYGVGDVQPTQSSEPMTAAELVLTICGWVWAAGIAAISTVTVCQHIRLKRHLATAWILRGNVYESEEIDTAFVMGVFSPKIYLPNGLPFDVQKAVLLHEQTHQARGDNIVKVIAYIALALHWFNPLVWLAYKLACDDMEKSCDEAVIRGMTKRGYDIKSVKYEYGKMLVAMGSGQWRLFSPVSFAENGTKARVMNVAKYKKVTVKSMAAMVLVCAVVLGAGCINPKSASIGVFLGGDKGSINIGGVEYSTDTEELVIDFPAIIMTSRQYGLSVWDYKSFHLSELSKFTNLKYLYINDSYGLYDTVDLSFLSHMKKLERLRLEGIYSEDYSPIALCQNLIELDIRGYHFPSYTLSEGDTIFKLNNLESLTVDYLDIDCVENLSKFENLKSFGLTEGFSRGDDKDKASSAVPTMEQTLTIQYDAQKLNEEGLKRLYDAIPNIQRLMIPMLCPDQASIISRFKSLNSLSFRNADYDAYNAPQITDPEMFEGLIGLTELKSLSIDLPCYYSLGFLRGMPYLEELKLSEYDTSALTEESDSFYNTVIPSKNNDNFMPIAECYKLKSLEISQTLFQYGADWDDINSYPELTFIYSLPELESISLNCLTIDISMLSCMDTLKTIDLNEANILNPESIGDAHNLEKLSWGADFINSKRELIGDEFKKLSGLTRLRVLEIGFSNSFTESSALSLVCASEMTELEAVAINAPRIYDVSGLRGSRNLEYLYLGCIDKNEDLMFLENMTRMKHLLLESNGGIDDISFINNMPELILLAISGSFSSLPDMKGHESLGVVSLRSSKLTDIEGLRDCSSVMKLELPGCYDLADADPIGSLNNLQRLDMESLSLRDIDFLVNNNSLYILNLSSNQSSSGDWLCDLRTDYLDDEDYISEAERRKDIKTDLSALDSVFPRLSKFFYSGDDLSYEQVRKYKELYPDCYIEYSPLITEQS